jgi:hypothetical protein
LFSEKYPLIFYSDKSRFLRELSFDNTMPFWAFDHTLCHNGKNNDLVTKKPREWLDNVHFMAAAKLYALNIVVCEPLSNCWRWQVYSPKEDKNLRVSSQDREFSSIFINFVNDNHFQVIVKPTVI